LLGIMGCRKLSSMSMVSLESMQEREKEAAAREKAVERDLKATREELEAFKKNV